MGRIRYVIGMNTSSNGQESTNVPRWTEQERERYAAQIAPARKALGLSQEDLSERADVTRRTIGSVERGDSIPQAAVLKRLMVALDIFPCEQGDFSGSTSAWLAALGPLIESLPEPARERVMIEVVGSLAQQLRRMAGPELVTVERGAHSPAASTPHATTATARDIAAGSTLPLAPAASHRTRSTGTTRPGRTGRGTT